LDSHIVSRRALLGGLSLLTLSACTGGGFDFGGFGPNGPPDNGQDLPLAQGQTFGTGPVRVALLLPVVVVLSLLLRRTVHRHRTAARDPLLPPFLVVFALLVAASSAGAIPTAMIDAMNGLARTCLVIAIAAVGLKTSPLEMKKVGARAFALLVVEAVFLGAIVLAAQALS